MVNEFSYRETVDAAIGAGASLSGAVYLDKYAPVMVLMPAVWDAAGLSFQVGETEAGTFRDVYDAAGEVVASQAAAGRAVALDPTKFGSGCLWLKVRSGTASVPVNQTAAATLTIVRRAI